ncbi:MAG: DotA/TraY family protein [Alphaproteobacteria bacterium]|nr:DotA/TraY family protein [Alphaproteobacteria bacterium]
MATNTHISGHRDPQSGPPSGSPSDPPSSGQKSGRGRKVAAYFLLPGIVPQIRELTRGGFGYLAFLIAYIYQAVRILPANHPYTNPDNIGKYGIRQVIAMAASHVQVNRQNIDQIIVFFAIFSGLVIMVLQFVAFILMLLSGEAFAQGAVPNPNTAGGADGLFGTANPTEDIAFHMMREVFGIPDMFGPLDGGPTAFHKALHTLFQFYNLAILLVAVLVFLYYVIVVVAETAQTGVPFGKRFSHIYAPLRLVIAIGLLVPLNYGLNGAQYITLFAAKVGSGFATTGWTNFNESLMNPTGNDTATLIAKPNVPDITGLVEGMSVIVACREAYKIKQNKEIKPWLVDKNGNIVEMDFSQYDTITQSNKDDVHILFTEGKANDPETEPLCGEVVVAGNVPDMPSIKAIGDASAKKIQEAYFVAVWTIWLSSELENIGKCIAGAHHEEEMKGCSTDNGKSYKPDTSYKEKIISDMKLYAELSINNVFESARAQVDFNMSEEVKKRGWGGAGIWYNKIAQVNGAYVTATIALPNIKTWPAAAEIVNKEKQRADSKYEQCKEFEPNLADNKDLQPDEGERLLYYAKVLNETHQYWRCDREAGASNIFWDTLQALFGLNGLFQIRDDIKTKDADGNTTVVSVHPLAKLSAVGKSLVESAVRNLAMAMTASFGGGVAGIISPHFQQAGQAFSNMFVSIATIGLSVGFILFYILPFLPFMYFFFAVGGWVKGIFEAMVGAPLWALAHLRIDGDGLPGKMAMNGYLLIFEIFLRPILTIFGLLGGMAIFTAMAIILNEVFDLVVLNVTGADISGEGGNSDDVSFGRHIIDEFFFTIVYAVILYMMAVASFKMINLVPNSILRWIGQSVPTFNDQSEDPTTGLVQYAAIGGAKIGGELAQGMTQLAGGGGSLVGALGNIGRGGAKGASK